MGKIIPYPVIDMEATGDNIKRLREERGLSVKDLQEFFGFNSPQAIYQWERGTSLPSVDNLFALSKKLEVSMEDILVQQRSPDGASPGGLPLVKLVRYWGKIFGLMAA